MALFSNGLGAAPNVGQALTMPQIPTGQADPSKIGLWQKFREKMANDPNFRMAIMTAGANMLKTPEFGQSGFDTFANAAMAGMGTLDTLRQRTKAETAEAQDRENTAEFRREQLGQGDERIALARGAENQRRVEAQQSYALRLRELEADRNSRGAAQNLTGAERQTNQMIDALVGQYPDRFPNTEDGRQKALIYLRDLDAAKANPTTLLRLVEERAARYELMGVQNADGSIKNVSSVEARELAKKEILGDLEGISGGNTVRGTASTDSLEGTVIKHVTQGSGTVEKVGEDRYRVRFKGGLSSTVSGAQIRRMQTQGQ